MKCFAKQSLQTLSVPVKKSREQKKIVPKTGFKTQLWVKSVRVKRPLKTYLGLLARTRTPSSKDTWASGTKKQVKKLLTGLDEKNFEKWEDMFDVVSVQFLDGNYWDIDNFEPEFNTAE